MLSHSGDLTVIPEDHRWVNLSVREGQVKAGALLTRGLNLIERTSNIGIGHDSKMLKNKQKVSTPTRKLLV